MTGVYRNSPPDKSVSPKAHTDESLRQQTYGRIQPMDEEALRSFARRWERRSWRLTLGLFAAVALIALFNVARHFELVNVGWQ